MTGRRPTVLPPHARRALAHVNPWLALAVAWSLGACGPPPGTAEQGGQAAEAAVDLDRLVPPDQPVPDWARREIGELVQTLQPLDPTLTSNVHDLQFQREKALVERLERAAPEVGWAALHAFTNYPARDYKVRRTLLRIGARAAPREAAPLLEALTFTYGFHIEDRTEACLLLAEVAPERYLELARPFVLRRGVLHQTLPNDEFLVRAWVTACERSGTSPVAALSDVAVNLMLEPYARVVALRALAEHELTAESRAALQTCLVESMGDSYIRRIAAQSIVRALPREDACALLREVRAREADVNMAQFLDDLIQESCR